ncbi:MAG TPA: NAD(P)-dependent oxidoreductase [Cytophagaceae bacterium]|jgi:D-3-phosphoglycerate dehydrogenase|nr:NAD(P)-dependent oxidoreductase [Cytophagaceae bacterium]
MIRCLIIDEMHSSIIPMLERIFVQPDYRPMISRNEIMDIIGNYEGIIIRSKTFLDKELLSQAIKLKFIARAGAGMDQIDMEEAGRRNILLLNAPEGNRDALAEHCIGMMLSLLNKICISDAQVRKGTWDRERNRGYELRGKTIGLIGYGFMGRSLAEKLKSFGCKVIAYDKYLKNFSDEYVQEVSMDEIFEETDILSLHIPLTQETKGMVNEDFFKRFKKDIWLINSARGEIIPLGALNKVLKSAKLRGAALDVLENEKLKNLNEQELENFNDLIASEKVVLTPHVGGWTFESYVRINQILADKIKAANVLQ